jgi:hypothetical protein
VDDSWGELGLPQFTHSFMVAWRAGIALCSSPKYSRACVTAAVWEARMAFGSMVNCVNPRRVLGVIAATGMALTLAGCSSGNSNNGGDPGARPLPAGMSCQSLRADLNRMDSQGAQSKVEAASQGKGSPEAKAVAERYNTLLNHYLGARCHV